MYLGKATTLGLASAVDLSFSVAGVFDALAANKRLGCNDYEEEVYYLELTKTGVALK